MFDPSKSLKKMLGKSLQVPRMMTGVKSSNDFDGDGIPNKKDCQPRNLIRQDKTRDSWEKYLREDKELSEFERKLDKEGKRKAEESYKKMMKEKVVTVGELSLIHAYIDYRFDPKKYGIKVDDSEELVRWGGE